MNKNIKNLKKSLGQNFLNNDFLAKKIVSDLSFNDADIILEIGPGNGALTKYITQKEYAWCHIVELDGRWAKYIKEQYATKGSNIIVFELDILLYTLLENKKYLIIGNIPYNITFLILQKIITWSSQITIAVIMMQEEVAQKLIKTRGTDYGPISILMQIVFDISLLEYVPATDFIPQPKVNSRVVQFIPKKTLLLKMNAIEKFKKFLSYFFVHPRKKIKHQGIDPLFLNKLSEETKNKRAQELSPEFFLDLFLKHFNNTNTECN